MSNLPRRTIPELATLYRLRPDIRDLFVEGDADKCLYEWYLLRRCENTVTVWAVDKIEVPHDLMSLYGLDIGNKGRAVAIALELDKLLPVGSPSRACVTVLVDSDGNNLIAPTIQLDILIWTSRSSVELVVIEQNAIDRFLRIIVHADLNAHRVIECLLPTLMMLWSIKTANYLTGRKMSWISFEKMCSLEGDNIIFDKSEFIRRYANHDKTVAAEIETVSQSLRGKVKDALTAINWHHFVDLFRWYLLQFLSNNGVLKDRLSFERALLGSVEISQMDLDESCQRVLERVCNSI